MGDRRATSDNQGAESIDGQLQYACSVEKLHEALSIDVVTHLANSTAAALPIPEAAPVTTATRPAWRTGCSSLSNGCTALSILKGVTGGRIGEGPREDVARVSIMNTMSTPVTVTVSTD